MPHIYDMGPTALLTLRRRLRPGLNPQTWVLKARTLPLDHRSRSAYLYINLCVNHVQMQCLGKVPQFLVNKVPIVVAFNSTIPQYPSLKNL